MPQDYEIFDLGDVRLQRGATLRDCKLAYKTFGKLSAAKDNAIVYPTWYSGQHYDNEWLVGSGMALDPDKYFIIIPNMLGNGLSSSPSNTPEPYNGSRFPLVTACDNVRVQHRLVTEKFGIKKLALVTGWSMGALQTFHWGALYPDMVERIAPFCGSAKCSRHNFVFLEGVKAALTADAAFMGRLVQRETGEGLAGDGARLCRLGIFAGLLSRAARPRAPRLFLARGFPGRLLGRLLPAKGCQQPSDHAVDLAERRYQRQRALQRRFQEGLGSHQGKGLCDARPDRPLLPAGGQPVRGRQHAQREIPARSLDLGPFRRPGTNPDDVKFLDNALKELLRS
jgi:homoserine O-acetyltransferase/O-succinyltransferase